MLKFSKNIFFPRKINNFDGIFVNIPFTVEMESSKLIN
jgi:hypothetical protein